MSAAVRNGSVLACTAWVVVACSTTATGPGGNGGALSTTVGSTSGSATPEAGPVYFYDGGPSSLPIIPETCAPDDAGCAGLTGVEYQCPGGLDASAPVNCAADPQTGTGPALYCCSNLCVSGCGDLPCPSEPCPAGSGLLVTCGPGTPDIEPGCTLIATRPAAQGLGQRFSFCCQGL